VVFDCLPRVWVQTDGLAPSGAKGDRGMTVATGWQAQCVPQGGSHASVAVELRLINGVQDADQTILRPGAA
jgi:hypothetical protein